MKHRLILFGLVIMIGLGCSGLLMGVIINHAQAMSSTSILQRTTQLDLTFLPCIMKPCTPFFDNFSNPSSGWPIDDIGDVLLEYKDGEYRILVRSTDWAYGAYPGFQALDYYVTVDLRNPSNVYGSYGIGFGIAQDWSTLYTLEIYPDGWYGIYRVDPSDFQTLAEDYSSIINQGSAVNQIKIERRGTLINAFANGQLLTSVTDGTYTGLLYIGLVVENYDQGNIDIRFDNFSVDPITCNGTKSLENSLMNWIPAWSVLPQEFNKFDMNKNQP
jgi:hypothetical protein